MKKTSKYIVATLFLTTLLGGLWACGESRTPSISAPENVFLCHNQTLDDTTEYILKWDGVKNAKEYKITAYGKTFTTTKTEYDLTYCAVENEPSQITVQAISNSKKFRNSRNRSIICTAQQATMGLIYNKREDGSYEISRNKFDVLEGSLILPDAYVEKSITKIADYGFAATTTTGEGYPANDYISVRFPHDLFSIGEGAFSNAENLISLTISSGTIIGDGAFSNCTSLKNLFINDQINYIGDSAFYGCSALKSVRLPASLKRVSSVLFMNCKNLESVTIPKGVTELSEDSFSDCDNLSNVIFEEGSQLLTIGDGAFVLCKSLRNITLPQTVVSIGAEAFSSCTTLSKITIPSSLESIGYAAFSNCLLLKSLTFPQTLEHLEEGALVNEALESISIDKNNPVYKSVDGVVFTKDGKTLFFYPPAKQDENYTVPQGIETICAYAFYHCKNLKTIQLPNQLKRIGNAAFCGSGITEINLPYGLTTVEDKAFLDCDNLTELTLPDSVIEMGVYALSAPNLKKITLSKGLKTFIQGSLTSRVELMEIPEGVEAIETCAFTGCNNLKKIILPTTLKVLSGAALKYSTSAKSVIADIYYKGTEEEWLRLKKANYNVAFENYFGPLNIYFYSEEEPRVKDDFSGYDGNYWHYAEDGITPVVWEL